MNDKVTRDKEAGDPATYVSATRGIGERQSDMPGRVTVPVLRLTRRDLLGRAGQGALGLTALVLCLEPLGVRRANARNSGPDVNGSVHSESRGGVRTLGLGAANPVPVYLALPFWGDGDWSQPQNYLTIQAGRRSTPKTRQSADIDGDGQDELIGRTATGILVNQFDSALPDPTQTNPPPPSGQWLPMSAGPALSDYSLGSLRGQKFGWEEPQYYRTIQTADINGDGKAELIARDNTGIKVWNYTPDANYARHGVWASLPDGPAWHDFSLLNHGTTAWDQADRYLTIQCADIDGDGRDELLGRSADPLTPYQSGALGMQVWKYTDSGWVQMPSAKSFSDANAWNYPQYYETIQCADIDGDGAKELLGRGYDGVHVWKYVPDPNSPSDPTKGSWNEMAKINDWWDQMGWNQPQYYTTIQCADVNRDGKAEVLARGPNGIVGYTYDSTAAVWNALGAGPGWSDASGVWNQEPYYSTIHFGDVDGFGRDMVIGRDQNGIQAWAYDPGQFGWFYVGDGTPSPPWADDPTVSPDGTAWNLPQHYQTIQFATVKNQMTLTGARTVLIGRAQINMQSWTLAASGFVPSTAKFPQYVSDGVPGSTADQQATAYQYINKKLTDIDPTQDIRAQYGQLDTSGVDTWHDQLSDDGDSPLSQPNGVFTDIWTDVRRQLKTELDLVKNVLTVQSAMHTWYTAQLALNTLTLSKVNGYLAATTTNTDNSINVINTALSLFASLAGIASLFTGPELTLALSLASYLVGAAQSAAALFPDDPNGVPLDQPQSLTYAQFTQALSDWFNNVQDGYDANDTAIVQDYGLLLIKGDEDVKWDTTIADTLLKNAQTAYEYSLWQAMVPYVWYTGEALQFPGGYNTSYGEMLGMESTGEIAAWVNADPGNYNTYPAEATLQYLFGALDAPVHNVLFGGQGWSGLAVVKFGPLGAAPPRTRISVKPTLVRDPVTDAVHAFLLLTNEGTETVIQVETTHIRLGSQNSLIGMPSARFVLKRGQSHEQPARFAPTGAPGATVILRVQGKYKGGTFGGSFRVKLP